MRGTARWLALAAMVLPAPLSAQGYLLQLRPRVGDTLVMRLEQESEMTGRRADGAAGGAATVASVVSTLRVFSRAIVESASAAATNLLAVTDSVLLSTSDRHSGAAAAQTQRLQGQRMRVRLAPDGSPAVAEGERAASRSVSEAMAMIPATFPKQHVDVGETWVREVPLPGGTTPFGGVLAGRLRATFRLDSVSRTTNLAYVSMNGELQAGDGDRVAGTSRLEDGTVRGLMVLDRARGWLSESQFTIVARSSVVLSAVGAPMRFTMKISQRLRTLRR